MDLHRAAKQGSVETVRALLEAGDCDVNAPDIFDSTPLFYAALVGSLEVAELLLANGARCDPGSFVGERCFYAALNDDLRRALRRYATDFSRKTKHYLQKFLLQLWSDKRCHDVEFLCDGGRVVSAPRLLLGARSAPLLRKFLAARWRGRGRLPAPRGRHPEALEAVVKYACVGRCVIDGARVADGVAVARTMGLAAVASFLETRRDAAPGASVVYEDELPFLRSSLAPLADVLARPDAEVAPESVAALAADHCDCVVESGDGVRFPMPSIFLRFHSRVLEAACSERWRRAEGGDGRALTLAAPAKAVAAVLRWCVCASCCDVLSRDAETAADALALAHELLLLAEVTNAAAGALAVALEATEGDEAEAAMAALPYAALAGERGRLYDAVVRVLSRHLDDATRRPDFRAAVLESAHSIQARQATDSIPLVDDIRVALHARLNPFDEDADEPGGALEAAELAKIDALLDDLGLSG